MLIRPFFVYSKDLLRSIGTVCWKRPIQENERNMTTSALQRINQKPEWKVEMSQLVTDPQELCRLLELDQQDEAILSKLCNQFSLRVPRPYLRRIKPGNLNDPLLLQVLPRAQELQETSGYKYDPLTEAEFSPVPGLLHKYKGRVLVVLNGSCAINCRYCFRRHFPYQEHQIGQAQWQAILDYIASDASIIEVIFSGGDPLTSTDQSLQKKLSDLEVIPHLKRFRLHTRLPVMIPSRIDEVCLDWMASTRLQLIVVIHSNHAAEIDGEVEAALVRLAAVGVRLLNQTVLLKDINNDANILRDLSERLFECGVLPYYLHLFDPVQGCAHFDLQRHEALQIRKDLQAILPGYLVPRLVVEEPNERNKTLL